MSARILVIGCVSRDVIHLEQKKGKQTYSTIGGAGLYTALAARCAGAEVTLVAPHPVDPDWLSSISPKPYKLSGLKWIGPSVKPEEMPFLEIAHHGDGRATLIGAAWNAETKLLPEHLPEDVSDFDIVHVAALSSAQRQIEFANACRKLKCKRLSAGTSAGVE